MNLNTINLVHKLKPFALLLLFMSSSFFFSQSKISIEGFVYDIYDYPVPYSSIGISKKNIGASSTEDGSFSFSVSKKELMDTLKVSSIGYESFLAAVDNSFGIYESCKSEIE